MKDLAHHLKKLNRQILRSIHREEMEDDAWEEKQETKPSPFAKKQTVKELKKQAKRSLTKTRKKRAATPKTPEEKNRLQKKRAPIYNKHDVEKPRGGARKTRKKTVRI
jgi:hypothetical protein